MIEADSVHSTPPTNSSSIQNSNPPPEASAESVDSFSHQPGIGQPDSGNSTSESLKTFESLDLAMLRFVRCLVRFGLTMDEAGAVIAGEVERLRTSGKQRRRMTLVGMRLVPAAV